MKIQQDGGYDAPKTVPQPLQALNTANGNTFQYSCLENPMD